MSVWDEFKAKYVQPRVEKVIVGFSGLDPDEYAFSLTDEQLNAIKDLILLYLSKLTIRIDSGSLDPNEPPPEVQPVTLKPAEIPHELLDELLGGADDGHYHVSDDELGKLRKLIEVLFPDGATEPKFPSVPATPSDDPSNPEEEIDTGLPKGTPPAWTQREMPSGYTAWDGYQKLYYGGVPYTKTGTRNDLLVAVNEGSNRRLLRTTNLTTWDKVISLLTAGGTGLDYTGNAIYDYLLLDGNGRKQLYIMYASTGEKDLRYFYTSSTSGNLGLSTGSITSQSKSGNKDSFVSAAYSPSLNMAIFVNDYHRVTCVKDNKALTTTAYKNLSIPINYIMPRGAAWNPDAQTFCVLGFELGGYGTRGIAAVSSNGQTWEYKEIGVLLTDLSYRSDLGCLFARCITNGHFYVSGDGYNWQQYSSSPLPVSDTFSHSYVPQVAFAYNPTLEWYCAVGGKSDVAYFSKDLKHWVSTKVKNAGTVEMGDVIWVGGSINRFLIMPKGGSQFFTFDPASWKDE